jgi:hypothetical protein
MDADEDKHYNDVAQKEGRRARPRVSFFLQRCYLHCGRKEKEV